MKLTHPFIISARLAPAVQIGDAYLSFDNGRFVLDGPFGEHIIEDFSFPRCRIAGATDESELQGGFASICSFLGACAESRQYATRTGRKGECADLFPEDVGQWAEQNSDEISMVGCEIEETPGAISD